MRDGRRFDYDLKEELAEENDNIEAKNVYGENWLFGKSFVTVKNARNDNNWRNKRDEFREEIVRIFAMDKSVIKPAKQNRCKGDFDMLPGAFVYCGKKSDDFVVFCDVVKEVGERAD